jgi:hypothetical protein
LKSRCFLTLLAAGLALAGYGCEGDKTVEPPPAPIVTISSPDSGATCSGDVLLSAEGENADLLTFYADSIAIGVDDTAPYETTWNSMTVCNGPHILSAKAEGIGGVTADSIDISVFNLVIVTISPDTAHVYRGHQRQFYATVEGALDTGVTWHVDEGKRRGTITSDGLFTAVDDFMSPLEAHIRGKSTADPTASAAAFVTLLPDLHIEAETCFGPGGTYGNIDNYDIHQSSCNFASGGLGVDGVNVDGEYIVVPIELAAELKFNTALQSARASGRVLTYEILFAEPPPGTGVWADTLVTLPGSGCC